MASSYSHLYLYAKGHYVRKDKVSDLQHIVGHYAGCQPEYVSKDDITTVVINAVMEHIFSIEPHHAKARVTQLLRDISKIRMGEPSRDSFTAIISECLGYLSTTRIQRDDGSWIIPLSEPDAQILPLAKVAKQAARNQPDAFPA